MKRILTSLACTAIVLSGCTGEPSPVTIGVSVAKSDAAFFKTMVRAARQEARRQGAVLVMSNADGSDMSQAADVDRLLDQGVDAIVIDAAGSRSVVDASRRAEEADVPVIALGDVVVRQRATTSVVGENVVAGRVAAEYLFFRMGGTGAAAKILPARLGRADREVNGGFEEIAKATPTVTITETRSSPVSAARVAAVTSRILEENPEVEGVFAATDEIALGVVEAARRLRVLRRVVIVSVGGTAPVLSAVEAGDLEGTVRNDPEEIGRLAVRAAVRAARGDPVPRRHVVDVDLVTEENVKRFLP